MNNQGKTQPHLKIYLRFLLAAALLGGLFLTLQYPQPAQAETFLPAVPAGTVPVAVAVNPVTNKIYVANSGSDNVTVIDGATNATTTVAAGTWPQAVGVNPVTNKIFVTNHDSDNVTVIDGATNLTTTVAAGTAPEALAVNPVTNKIYVANRDSDNVTVIDGATNATTTVAAGNYPNAVAVNPVTDKVYVANSQSNNVTVIDGATNATNTVAAGMYPITVAVNPVTNNIYAANWIINDVTVIDGANNTTTTLAAGTDPLAVAVNPVTSKIYVANSRSNDVTVITEQTVQPNPLNVSINKLPGNTSSVSDPTFTILAESVYSPIAPPVLQVYYQVDTWQGGWLSATEKPLAPSATTQWSAQIPPQGNGIHILYAYAVDGQDAGSVNPSPSYSPIIGRISAYLFLVRAPWPVAFLPLVLR